LLGTCRARLIDQGIIREVSIKIDQLNNFQSFCRINAMVEEFESPLPIVNIKDFG